MINQHWQRLVSLIAWCLTLAGWLPRIKQAAARQAGAQACRRSAFAPGTTTTTTAVPIPMPL